MINSELTLDEGTILIIETGEYSDHSWHGPVRILKTVTRRELSEKFQSDWIPDPLDEFQTTPEPYDFLPWLVKNGFAEHVDNVQTWHVGSYGRFEP